VFLGSSYLRAVGRGHGYGMSARGLAIDTALPSGEEFPAFREFWIERPSPDDTAIVVYALLDSPRATGAYRFAIHPGAATVMEVRARIYLRSGVGKLGIAPLTSMYFYGENQPAPAEDYRPEVHDSDGLLIAGADGERIWRPLVNPKRLLVTSFAQRNPKGFGLLQRDRAYGHYEDLEARYERRPSAWVEPIGDWGTGRVELVQIPSANEFNDNVVAYWVPDTLPAPRTALELAYRLKWLDADEPVPSLARVTQTRRGAVGDDTMRFIVDLAGGSPPGEGEIEPAVWCDTHGEVLEKRAYRNDVTGGWRMVVTVRRKDRDEPIELRANVPGKDGPLSETWSYIWPPS
jgi:periplasmic glucans biosynthesis protein